MIVKIVKIYLGHSLVLWTVYGQFIFGQFFGLAYISQGLYFQGSSLCFSFFCLLVSSVSVFRLDTRGTVVGTFLGSLVQSCCGEGGMLQTNNTGMCMQCLSPAGPPHAHSAHRSRSTLLHREPSEAGPRLRAPPRSKPLRFGAQVALRGSDSVGTAFCAIPASEQLRSQASTIAMTCRLSCLCCSAFWVYCWRPL